MNGLVTKVRAYAHILPKAKRNRFDLVGHLVRRPAFLLAVGGYELASFVSGRVDVRTKSLASVKASSMIGCPY